MPTVENVLSRAAEIARNAISNSIGEANGAKDISKLFLEQYRSLYNSVLTDENELNSLRDVIDSNITEQIYIIPDIIRICISKDDSDIFPHLRCER